MTLYVFKVVNPGGVHIRQYASANDNHYEPSPIVGALRAGQHGFGFEVMPSSDGTDSWWLRLTRPTQTPSRWAAIRYRGVQLLEISVKEKR